MSKDNSGSEKHNPDESNIGSEERNPDGENSKGRLRALWSMLSFAALFILIALFGFLVLKCTG